VRRFVHVSSLSAREPQLSAYGASKRAGEDLVRASDRDWTIVRPSGVYGPGDTEMRDMFRMAQMGLALLPPPGKVALVAVDSVLRKLPVRAAPGRIDAPSMALLPLATTAMLFALSWGGLRHPWLSLPVLGAAALALLAGWMFWRRQHGLEEPVFAPGFLADPVVGRVLPAMFFGFGAYLALAITLPVFLQVVLGQSPGDAGLLMIPLTFSTTITAYWSGRFLRRTGNYRRPPLLGFPLAAAAALIFAAFVDHASPWSTALLMLGIGLGIGPIFPTAIVAAQNAVAPRDIDRKSVV
jgi:hypothetical protein